VYTKIIRTRKCKCDMNYINDRWNKEVWNKLRTKIRAGGLANQEKI